MAIGRAQALIMPEKNGNESVALLRLGEGGYSVGSSIPLS